MHPISLQEIPPVLGWGDAFRFLEHLCKYPVIPIARLLRHLCNGKGGGEQQLLRLFHPDIGQIGQEIHADFALKQLADILGIQMELFSQNGETDFLRQMLLKIPRNAGDRPFLLLLRFRRSRYPLLIQGDLQIVDAGAKLLVVFLLFDKSGHAPAAIRAKR